MPKYTATKEENDFATIPCTNCGTPVQVMLPFNGCVFCSQCVGGRSVAYMFKEEADDGQG